MIFFSILVHWGRNKVNIEWKIQEIDISKLYSFYLKFFEMNKVEYKRVHVKWMMDISLIIKFTYLFRIFYNTQNSNPLISKKNNENFLYFHNLN